MGYEVCPTTQQPHIQGFIEFEKPVYWTALKALFGNDVHVEPTRGTREQARNYCMKDNDYYEVGTIVTQGQRTDLTKLMKQVQAGKFIADIIEDDPVLAKDNIRFLQYYKQAYEERKEYLDYQKELEDFKDIRLYDYQENWRQHLENQTNRTITWVWDNIGEIGKSTFANRLEYENPQNVFVFENGKNKDIAYSYKGQRYVILDLKRSLESHVNYNIIESFKDGRMFCPKWKSRLKRFKWAKLIIFANFPPDRSTLS